MASKIKYEGKKKHIEDHQDKEEEPRMAGKSKQKEDKSEEDEPRMAGKIEEKKDKLDELEDEDTMAQSDVMSHAENELPVPTFCVSGPAAEELPATRFLHFTGEEVQTIEDFLSIIDDQKPNLRGGALGSHTTEKKRQLRLLMTNLQKWVEDIDEEKEWKGPTGQQAKEAIKTLVENMDKWTKDIPTKQDARKVVEQTAERIGQGLGGNTEGGQSFYGRFLAKKTEENEWMEVKNKGKGKGKGKKKGEDQVPRFDLQRKFPKAEITHHTLVRKALEEGNEPAQGQICICRSVDEICEFQSLAEAFKVTRPLILIARVSSKPDEQQPKNSKQISIPYIGNIAITKATVAQLDGKEAEFNGLQVEEAQIQQTANKDVLRITVPLKYVSSKKHEQLRLHPELCLALAGIKETGFKTEGWEEADDIMTGYVKIPEGKKDAILQQSGRGAVFWQQLAKNIIKKPSVVWLPRDTTEADLTYFDKAQAMAIKENVPLVFRRGNGSDLGIQREPDKVQAKAYAAWGIPGHMSPEMLKSWLEERGWEIEHRPTEPRSLRGPWKIFGKHEKGQENDEFSYLVTMNGKQKYINIVQWRSFRKPQSEIQTLAAKRWFNPQEEIIENFTPTQEQIPATRLDTPEDEEDVELLEDQDGRPSKQKREEPHEEQPKKKQKKQDKIRGGERGPALNYGTCRTLDCGGDGNCAWKAVSYMLCMENLKWSADYKDQSKVTEKIDKYATALRTQAIRHLLHTDRSWTESWSIDPAWTNETEAGEPATDLESFEKVLARPSRYICELGLRSIATVKKCNLVIWQRVEDEWEKIAIIQPPKAHSGTPTFGLVLSQGHYLALHYEKKANGKCWIDQDEGKTEDCYRTKGVMKRERSRSRDRKSEKADKEPIVIDLRGAGGGGFETPKKVDFDDVDFMLRTCSSKDKFDDVEQCGAHVEDMLFQS